MEPYYRERLMTLLLENMARPVHTSSSRVDTAILEIGKLAYLAHCFAQAYLPSPAPLLSLQTKPFVPWSELEQRMRTLDGPLTPELLRRLEYLLMPLFHCGFPLTNVSYLSSGYTTIASSTTATIERTQEQQQVERDTLTMTMVRKAITTRLDYWLQPQHYINTNPITLAWQMAAYRALIVFPWVMDNSGRVGLGKRLPNTLESFLKALGERMGPVETFYTLLPQIIHSHQTQSVPPPTAQLQVQLQTAMPRLKQEYDQWKSTQAAAMAPLPKASAASLLGLHVPHLMIRGPAPTTATTSTTSTTSTTTIAKAATLAASTAGAAPAPVPAATGPKSRAPKRKHEAVVDVEGGEILETETENSAEAQHDAKRPRVEC